MTQVPRQSTVSPFERYADAIVLAAGEIYRADREGLEPDPTASQVALAQNLGDLSPEALHGACIAQAELNVGARVVARVAALQDEKEAGGPQGLLAGTELFLTKLVERKYLKGALQPGGAVDRVRGKNSIR